MISFYIEKVALEQVSLSQARLSHFALYFHPLRSRQNTRNKDIKGITVCGNEIKICQYADDTMILDGKKSFISALLDQELFGVISGLRLNNNKKEILWIGACARRQDKLCPEKDLKWTTDKLKALGVWISSDPVVSMKANYNEKLLKVRNCLSCWEYSRLSLLGKIVVLKS